MRLKLRTRLVSLVSCAFALALAATTVPAQQQGPMAVPTIPTITNAPAGEQIGTRGSGVVPGSVRPAIITPTEGGMSGGVVQNKPRSPGAPVVQPSAQASPPNDFQE